MRACPEGTGSFSVCVKGHSPFGCATPSRSTCVLCGARWLCLCVVCVGIWVCGLCLIATIFFCVDSSKYSTGSLALFLERGASDGPNKTNKTCYLLLGLLKWEKQFLHHKSYFEYLASFSPIFNPQMRKEKTERLRIFPNVTQVLEGSGMVISYLCLV